MKLYVYAGALAVVLSFAYWYSERQYDAGYSAATAKYVTQALEHTERAIEQQRALFAQEREVLEEGFRVERVIRTEIREVENAHVETPGCDALGPEWLGLYNRAVRAANTE